MNPESPITHVNVRKENSLDIEEQLSDKDQGAEHIFESARYPFFKGSEKYVSIPEHRRDIWLESGLELKGYHRQEIAWEDIDWPEAVNELIRSWNDYYSTPEMQDRQELKYLRSLGWDNAPDKLANFLQELSGDYSRKNFFEKLALNADKDFQKLVQIIQEGVITDCLRAATDGRAPDHTMYHVYGAWGRSTRKVTEHWFRDMLSEKFFDWRNISQRIQDAMSGNEESKSFFGHFQGVNYVHDYLRFMGTILVDNTAGTSSLVSSDLSESSEESVMKIGGEWGADTIGWLILHHKETGELPDTLSDIKRIVKEEKSRTTVAKDTKNTPCSWRKIDRNGEIEVPLLAEYATSVAAVCERIFTGNENFFYIAPLSVAGDTSKGFSKWGNPVRLNSPTLFFGDRNNFFKEYRNQLSDGLRHHEEEETVIDRADEALPRMDVRYWGGKEGGDNMIGKPVVDENGLGYGDIHPVLPVAHGALEFPRIGWAWAECIYIPTEKGINVVIPDVREK